MEYTKKDHLTFVQKEYQGKTFQNIAFERSDIDNCKVENCRFSTCNFNRSSIVCVRAKNCVFERCKFQNADILSGDFTNCQFQECDFSLANICDNIFCRNQFVRANFLSTTIKENEFLDSNFMEGSFRGSLTSLNIFRQTSVQDSEFGNCTVDYNILERCVFRNSWLNAEMLGTFFGLHLKDLQECKFLFLGEEVLESDCRALCSRIRSQFDQESRYMEMFILDVNSSFNQLLPATEQLCADLMQKMLNGDYVPADQFQFLFYVYKELYRQKHLGFLALYQLKRGIQAILDSVSPAHRCYEKVVLLYNNLNLIYNSMMADLGALSDSDFLEIDQPIVVRFTFENKPHMAMDEMLETCYSFVFDHSPSVHPTVLLEQSGSYIVFLSMTIQTLLAFRICTYLLAGSIKELVKIRANTSLLVGKKLPKKYFLEVTKPESTITVSQAVAALLTNLVKKALPASLKNLPVPDISEDNLKEIQEIPAEDVPPKASKLH